MRRMLAVLLTLLTASCGVQSTDENGVDTSALTQGLSSDVCDVLKNLVVDGDDCPDVATVGQELECSVKIKNGASLSACLHAWHQTDMNYDKIMGDSMFQPKYVHPAMVDDNYQNVELSSLADAQLGKFRLKPWLPGKLCLVFRHLTVSLPQPYPWVYSNGSVDIRVVGSPQSECIVGLVQCVSTTSYKSCADVSGVGMFSYEKSCDDGLVCKSGACVAPAPQVAELQPLLPAAQIILLQPDAVKVLVCHKPKKVAKTLSISASALKAHLAHGDELGRCEDDHHGKGHDDDDDDDHHGKDHD